MQKKNRSKRLFISKRLLALLIGGNILFTAGCFSLHNEKKEDTQKSTDISYSQSSIMEESSKGNKQVSKAESSKDNSQVSKDESSKTLESKMEESEESINEVTTEESIEEDLESSIEEDLESSIEEEPESNIEKKLESSIEEEPESSIEEEPESSVEEESYEEQLESSTYENNYEEELESSIEEESYDEEIYTDDDYYIRAQTTVNVRNEPNTNSDVLSHLYEGDMLKKMGYVGNWYIVDYNGNKAYVSADYTEQIRQEHKNEDLTISNICYFPYGATLYSDKDLNDKILDVPALESGVVYYQEGNSYFVETEGYNGYVPMSSLSFLNNSAIIVDISDQILKFYENNQLILECPVITGSEDPYNYHPSTEGLFTVYNCSSPAELVGPYNPETDTYEWDVWVDYFIAYNYNGEGLHDADWQPSFGEDYYLHRGSHGCTNMFKDNARVVYEHAKVGETKVLIKR